MRCAPQSHGRAPVLPCRPCCDLLSIIFCTAAGCVCVLPTKPACPDLSALMLDYDRVRAAVRCSVIQPGGWCMTSTVVRVSQLVCRWARQKPLWQTYPSTAVLVPDAAHILHNLCNMHVRGSFRAQALLLLSLLRRQPRQR